jgi:hypothetical protein
MRLFIIMFGVLVLVAACTASLQESDSARQALINYFDALNRGDYASAAALYGGNYGNLQGMNPDIDPTDYVALLQRGCVQNGLQCLATRTVSLDEQVGDTYVFLVEFSNPEDSLFVRGPCCGASETEMPSVSQFSYTVVNTGGKYLVQELPVYVP